MTVYLCEVREGAVSDCVCVCARAREQVGEGAAGDHNGLGTQPSTQRPSQPQPLPLCCWVTATSLLLRL